MHACGMHVNGGSTSVENMGQVLECAFVQRFAVCVDPSDVGFFRPDVCLTLAPDDRAQLFTARNGCNAHSRARCSAVLGLENRPQGSILRCGAPCRLKPPFPEHHAQVTHHPNSNGPALPWCQHCPGPDQFRTH